MSRRKINNISFCIANHLCTGCGICEDICPQKCISIQRTQCSGELRPSIGTSCINCGKCLKICPGLGIDFDKYMTREGIYTDKYIGKYIGLHVGYSFDQEIRYHSASGGVVSQFLIYLLDKKIIDGAVVTGYGKDKITPLSYIARTREEIIQARSSKYCPVSLNKIGNEIANFQDGKYVIVGLPCHIQGFRKRMAIDRKFKSRIIGLFSIYCSSERTFNAQDYLLDRYEVNKEEISYFAYRDNGCLGYLTIETPNKKVSVPYEIFYGPMLRSFFKTHRCLTCIDHYGELADVNFGDIHISPYDFDKIGISSWITRSQYWEDQFIAAQIAGYIQMDIIDADTLNNSQKAMLFPKQRKAKALMNLNLLRGLAIPRYDKALENPSLKDYISIIICLGQMYVGRHRGMWRLIDILNKNK